MVDHKSKQPDQSAQREQEFLELLQRTRADFENFRKRTEEQVELATKRGAETTLFKLLPLIDTFLLAIKAHPAELAPLNATLDKTLKDLQLEVIDFQPDLIFDPQKHEAVVMEGSDGTKELVTEVMRPGYLYAGQTLRPAMVKVKIV